MSVSALQKEVSRLKKENEDLRRQIKHDSKKKALSHDKELWNKLSTQIGNCQLQDTRELLASGKFTVFDTSPEGHTLLTVAAKTGQYHLVQLCINLGADISHIAQGKTAKEWAAEGGWVACQQLLSFASLNAAIGAEVGDYAHKMDKQAGFVQNFTHCLSTKKDSKTVSANIVDIMIEIILSRLYFSDDMLNLAWTLAANESQTPLQNRLWLCISSVCQQIVNAEGQSERDQHWFKTYLLPSTIWLIDIGAGHKNDAEEKQADDEKSASAYTPTYLYYELLKMIEKAGATQLKGLTDSIGKLKTRSPAEWEELIRWDIQTLLEGDCRQDRIPFGIKSAYSKEGLLQQTMTADFSADQHYDLNSYLSELMLLAHIVDDNFQKDVQKIFNIDAETKTHVNSDNGDVIQYMRGPVKTIQRARAKAETDYRNEPFPTSACILDLNRCSLIFDDIAAMLRALRLFQNKVQYFQSGCIIELGRDKNGFNAYSNEPQYADIKLNVVIRSGDGRNIVGEVQFLLRQMMEYKRKAHKLYEIQRREELFDGMKSILPKLLDLKQQLYVSGGKGDIKRIVDIMAVHNKGEEFVMQIDDETTESIMNTLIPLKRLKAVKKLKAVMFASDAGKKLFIERLLTPNRYGDPAYEGALRRGHYEMAKYLFSIEAVKQAILSDEEHTWTLLLKQWRSQSQRCFNLINELFGFTDDDNALIKKYASYSAATFNKTYSKWHEGNLAKAAYQYAGQQRFDQLSAIIGAQTALNLFYAT